MRNARRAVLYLHVRVSKAYSLSTPRFPRRLALDAVIDPHGAVATSTRQPRVVICIVTKPRGILCLAF